MNKENLSIFNNDIFIDASAFLYLDDDAVNHLSKSKEIIISSSFDLEMDIYKKYHGPQLLSRFERNIQRLNSAGNVTIEAEEIGNDIYQILCYYTKNNKQVSVIVGNDILLQKICFDHLLCDVYDAKNDTYILHNDQDMECKKYKSLRNTDENIQAFDLFPGDIVYGKKKHYTLDKQIENGDGSEAFIFQLSGEDSVLAKIFKSDEFNSLPKSKISNIKNLSKIVLGSRTNWFLNPLDILYIDEHQNVAIGYVMTKVHNVTGLEDMPFMHNAENITPECDRFKFKDLMSYCLEIISKVYFLQSLGVLVTDYNQKNFGFDHNQNIILFDTDSFSYKDYVSSFNNGCLMSRNYDLSNKRDIIAFSEEGLITLCFCILTLGNNEPFDTSGKFVYSDNNIALANPAWYYLPSFIREMFSDMYEGKRPFSVVEVYQSLCLAIVKEPMAQDSLYHIFQDYAHIISEPSNLGYQVELFVNGIKWMLTKKEHNRYVITEYSGNKNEYINIGCIRARNEFFIDNSTDLKGAWRIQRISESNGNFKLLIESEQYAKRVLTYDPKRGFAISICKSRDTTDKEKHCILATGENASHEDRLKNNYFLFIIIGSIAIFSIITVIILLIDSKSTSSDIGNSHSFSVRINNMNETESEVLQYSERDGREIVTEKKEENIDPLETAAYELENIFKSEDLNEMIKQLNQVNLKDFFIASKNLGGIKYFYNNGKMFGVYIIRFTLSGHQYVNDQNYIYYGDYDPTTQKRHGHGIWINIISKGAASVYVTEWKNDCPNGYCEHYVYREGEYLQLWEAGNVIDGLWDGKVKNYTSSKEYTVEYNMGMIKYYDKRESDGYYLICKDGVDAWINDVEDPYGIDY